MLPERPADRYQAATIHDLPAEVMILPNVQPILLRLKVHLLRQAVEVAQEQRAAVHRQVAAGQPVEVADSSSPKIIKLITHQN
ncbi:hypothetical protein D9M68_856650 [compost metagenome]